MQPAMSFEYTRQHDRVPFPHRIGVQIAEWPALMAQGHDVSHGGISVILPHELSVGDRLAFGFVMPDRSRRTIHAEVRYAVEQAGEYKTGMRWLNLRSDEAVAIESFVSEVEAKQ